MRFALVANLLRGMVVEPVPAGLVRGRFCFEGQNEADGRRVLEFACPSGSRMSRLYWMAVDVDTLECDCRCEDFAMRRGTAAGRYEYGTDTEKEHLCRQPQITRKPWGLCVHLQKVQSWIKRRGLDLLAETGETG